MVKGVVCHLDSVDNTPVRSKHYGLVVDGQSLIFALNASQEHLEAFQDICRACAAVICCRMSPLQKCKVWILTGDQVETAVNISLSCCIWRLLPFNSNV
jgi:magnesium-transporting ATPase (P-type)